MSDELDEMGPIDYLVVELAEGRRTGRALDELVKLVDRGIIRILDLALFHKDVDGSVSGVELTDLDGDGELDAVVFQGASSGLVGPEELEEAASAVLSGRSAAVLLYENVWAAPLAVELRRAGGQLVASGRIHVQALLAALDATEPADQSAQAADDAPQSMDPTAVGR